MHNTDRPRCRWVTDDLLLQYHDTVYGRRRSTDRELFAKLCLEGVRTAGGSLYFLNPAESENFWVMKNRPYVTTIGSHSFYA